MVTDPISDMLTRIKNGYMAHLSDVGIPYSKMKFNLAKVLAKESYIKDIKIVDNKAKKNMIVTLLYDKNQPKLRGVQRISKPGVRIYTAKNDIPKVLGGLGLVILTTSAGLLTGTEAKKKGLGGEIICKVW